jgi:hypothetical protein
MTVPSCHRHFSTEQRNSTAFHDPFRSYPHPNCTVDVGFPWPELAKSAPNSATLSLRTVHNGRLQWHNVYTEFRENQSACPVDKVKKHTRVSMSTPQAYKKPFSRNIYTFDEGINHTDQVYKVKAANSNPPSKYARRFTAASTCPCITLCCTALGHHAASRPSHKTQ